MEGPYVLCLTVVVVVCYSTIATASPEVSTKNGHITITTDANKDITIQPGTGGKLYLKNVVSDASSGGTGSTGGTTGGTSTPQCGLVPTCPYWMNVNVTMIPSRGGARLEFATSGLSNLFHPSFNPSFTCKFTSSRQTATSVPTNVTIKTDTKEPGLFYVVVCTVPDWGFVSLATFSESVKVTLWFQGNTEIPFAGIASWQMATMFTAVLAASQKPGSITLNTAGLDTSLSYLCRFSDSLITSQYANTAIVSTMNSSQIVCPIPAWTASTKRSVSATVDLYIVTSSQIRVPFQGKKNPAFIINSCFDGAKNGDETDIDCGGSCTKKCTGTKSCRATSDCIATFACISSVCTATCTGSGWVYKGICLRKSVVSGSFDQVPTSCTAYQPSVAWTKGDYTAICTKFGGPSSCTNVDTDANGGRCSNYKAILGYENTGVPDVWVHINTFAWNPTISATPDCQINPNPPATLVYACQ